jgi:hypothetical protein
MVEQKERSAVGQEATRDLLDQYRRAFQMLYEEIERFDATEWVKGLDFFQVPAKVAMHTVDCLDYYFCGKTQDEYRWGYRFGGGWWELPDDRLPDVAAVLAYAHEIEDRVVKEFGALQDEDLARPFVLDDAAKTLLGHYVYALRHTMHHQGELATLNVHHGNEGGVWA